MMENSSSNTTTTSTNSTQPNLEKTNTNSDNNNNNKNNDGEVDYLLTDYSLVDPWRVPQDLSTHVRAIFIPFLASTEPFEIYLPKDTVGSDTQVKKIMKAAAISKRYIAKKDESCMIIQDFIKKPTDTVAVQNHRANVILCSKKELYGNVVLTYRQLDENRVWTLCHDLSLEMYNKLYENIGKPIFDFKNNYHKYINYIETICCPTDFQYPSDNDPWTADKLPQSILNEYYATIGKGIFQPVKHEFAKGGPFACLYNVTDGDKKKIFASKSFKQLKAAQGNLALKLLHHYLNTQNMILHGIPYDMDADTSYDEFLEEQERFANKQEEKALEKASKMEVDQVVFSKTSEPKIHLSNDLLIQQLENHQEQQIPQPSTQSSSTPHSQAGYLLVFDKFKVPEDSIIMTLGEDDGVTKFIIKEGRGDYPLFGTKVIAKYQTFLETGVVVDEKLRQETFDIGITENIKGMDLALFNMKQGEKALIKIEPKYGYGKLGAMPIVPPNSILVVYMEIINVQHKTTPAQQQIDNMPPQEKLAAAESIRAEGKRYFERKWFGKCLKLYKTGLKYLDLNNVGTVTVEEWDKFQTLGTFMCVNLAITYSKMDIWERCRAYCTMAITIYHQEESPKPYFWRAKANLKLEYIEYAYEDICQAIKYSDEKDIESQKIFLKYRDYIQKQLDSAHTKERKAFEKVFHSLSEEDELLLQNQQNGGDRQEQEHNNPDNIMEDDIGLEDGKKEMEKEMEKEKEVKQTIPVQKVVEDKKRAREEEPVKVDENDDEEDENFKDFVLIDTDVDTLKSIVQPSQV